MWKENGNGQGEITAAQKARISQNFRAAKALLDRKRNRPTVSPETVKHKSRVVVAEADSGRRVPLAEITNDPSGSSCISYNPNPNFPSPGGNKGVAAFGLPIGSFVTPLKERHNCSVLSSNFSTPTSILDELDDDFDESVLLEIDAVCERESAAKAAEERRSVSHSEDVSGVKEEGSSDPSGLELVVSGQSTVTLSRFSFGGEEDTDTTAQVNNVPEEYSRYWQSLNDRQREAACNDISIPTMIVAGPGSGKTSTMVGRVLMLLSEGIGSSNILAMTFTTAAAAEMRDRIGAVAGKATSKKLTISTFHSFSLQLCRSHADKLGRTPEFSIYGHGHQRRAIIEAVRLVENEKMDERNQDAEKLAQDSGGKVSLEQCKDKSKKWQKFVTQAKASGRTPADCLKMGDKIGANILQHYNDILKSCDALDYHDLISCSVTLLSEFPEVFKECQETWKAIVIDEFQDTSAMQYNLLRLLASHKRITIVGDDDQSIFSFNGADISGFDSFRRDFANYKEIRLNKNYRSTCYIVEAASCLIKHNIKRCQLKDVLTDNSSGSKITIKECQHESAQCAFVVDKILESASHGLPVKPDYSKFAILYRRQVSGKLFQSAFRERKIPFNTHGVAFYRKKVVKAIMAMLRTTLPGCDDGSYRQVFKAFLSFEKEEKKKVVEHIEKISNSRKCSFISAASDIFGAKVSGTFKRSQLTQGRKVLSTLEMISKLVLREQSISTVVTSVANMVPQKYLLEQKAVIDNDGGKYLNEDNDMRSVLQYLLDDVSDFLSSQSPDRGQTGFAVEEKGCRNLLKAFVDYITEREKENFRCRRHENENSVTLTTIHQSKGLEWDTVFIIKVNESEIPLVHEYNGVAKENGTSIEEERRLLYVAMTRARKKLFILYMTMDSNWQLLQPSRFLKEIPDNVREVQAEVCLENLQANISKAPNGNGECPKLREGEDQASVVDKEPNDSNEALHELSEQSVSYYGSTFLKRFAVEERLVVSHLFNHWAKKQAFQNPKRLLDKVGFVADERLRVKKNKHKDVLRALKSCLHCDEAFQYAEYVLRWEKIPADQRAHMMREKQEHFQKLRIETSMSSSAPTAKQISYLQTLGCTVTPTSRLHASTLIEQYKAL